MKFSKHRQSFSCFTSIAFNSRSLQSKIPALYLTTPIAHALIALIKLPPYSFDFATSFTLFIYSCLTFSFISFCIMSAPSKTPKYLYPLIIKIITTIIIAIIITITMTMETLLNEFYITIQLQISLMPGKLQLAA